MSTIIRAIDYANGQLCPVAGQWLRSFDFEAYGGRGFGEWTVVKGKAMRFASVGDAMLFWKTQSKTVPLRSDGKPNRPLTSVTITFDEV